MTGMTGGKRGYIARVRFELGCRFAEWLCTKAESIMAKR